MKKLLSLILIACAITAPSTLLAQKKTNLLIAKKSESSILQTKPDSISYALGVAIAGNGIESYLIQSGVLTDTLDFKNTYDSRIENAIDTKEKERLNKEFRLRLDSINKANTVNKEDFLQGLAQAMNQDQSKTAYNSGIAIGSQLSASIDKFSQEVIGENEQFSKAAFIAAFSQVLKNDNLLIDNDKAEAMIQEASEKTKEASELARSKGLETEYADKIAEGKAFFAENQLKEGVVTSPSGLQYKVITMGSGEKPTQSDRVKVHYSGRLLDGTVFDSSIERGEPITFGVQQVIKGWTEVLQLMPVGSKWEIYIPYNLAYGDRDNGKIKPFSDLIFEIELLDIEK